jgi:hypothetical protein
MFCSNLDSVFDCGVTHLASPLYLDLLVANTIALVFRE